MGTILIGDRKEFAIEYQINKHDSHLLGNLCLWIGNVRIGYYDEETLLLVTKSALEGIDEKLEKIKRKDLSEKNKEDLFEQMYSSETENGIYLVTPGESFDDFSIFTFSYEDTLYFCWKLNENPFFDYEDYPKDIQLKTVPIAVFKKILGHWSEQLSA